MLEGLCFIFLALEKDGYWRNELFLRGLWVGLAGSLRVHSEMKFYLPRGLLTLYIDGYYMKFMII